MTNEELLKLIQSGEDYQVNYDLLVSSCKNRGLNKSSLKYYTECHHIIPKCLGGKDENDNYVLFTYPEHVIAHILLYKIHPKKKGLIMAAYLMLTPGNKKSISENQLEEFTNMVDSFNLDLLTELKELGVLKMSKPVACMDIETGEILKIYKSISEIEKDGFYKDKIYDLNKSKTNVIEYWGYKWKYINNLSIPTLGITPIPIRNRMIVCHDGSKIYYVANNILELAKNSKFSASSLESAISSGNRYKLYQWTKLKDFIIRYKNIPISKIINARNNPIPRYYETCGIACIDPKTNIIIKIYECKEQVREDNLVPESIKSSKLRFGYYWERLSNLSLEQLEEYYSRDSYLTPHFTKWTMNLVQIDENRNIISVIPSEKRSEFLKETGLSQTRIITSVRENRPYNGFWWMKYEDYANKYPDKLKEYESRENTKISDKAK